MEMPIKIRNMVTEYLGKISTNLTVKLKDAL